MTKQTNQGSEIRDQPGDLSVNPCSHCARLPELVEHNDCTAIKCSCGKEVSVQQVNLSEFDMSYLETCWNINCISSEFSDEAKATIGIEDGDFIVASLENYKFHSEIFCTLLEAMNYMKFHFYETLERTSLFQLRGNELEWIFTSDDIV